MADDVEVSDEPGAATDPVAGSAITETPDRTCVPHAPDPRSIPPFEVMEYIALVGGDTRRALSDLPEDRVQYVIDAFDGAKSHLIFTNVSLQRAMLEMRDNLSILIAQESSPEKAEAMKQRLGEFRRRMIDRGVKVP